MSKILIYNLKLFFFAVLIIIFIVNVDGDCQNKDTWVCKDTCIYQ